MGWRTGVHKFRKTFATRLSNQVRWEAWLEYFLNGVARQSEDALGRAERINQRLGQWRRAVAVPLQKFL